jgi:hypothetical protein
MSMDAATRKGLPPIDAPKRGIRIRSKHLNIDISR